MTSKNLTNLDAGRSVDKSVAPKLMAARSAGTAGASAGEAAAAITVVAPAVAVAAGRGEAKLPDCEALESARLLCAGRLAGREGSRSK